jgi:hypothetical protein
MTRWIIKQVGDTQAVCTGHDFDQKTERVTCWDAKNSEHIFELSRETLVNSPTLKVLWWNDDNTLNYAG